MAIEGVIKQGGPKVARSDITNTAGPAIKITHVASNQVVAFKAFVTSFSDSFASEYEEENLIGRMDSIMVYKSTKRKINLEFQVVAGSLGEAKRNLKRISVLANMMYPQFHKEKNFITSSPLLRVDYGNLLKSSSGQGGLLVAAEGFDYTPDFEDLVFYDDENKMYPKLTSVNMQFTVIHEHDLGWSSGSPKQDTFPYDIKLESSDNDEGSGAVASADTTNRAKLQTAKEQGVLNAGGAMKS